MGAEGLHVVLRGRLYQHVHIDAGQAYQPGVQRAALHDALHLDDHHAAAVPGGLGLGQGLRVHALPLEGAVAPGIGVAGPDHGHLDGEGGVEEHLLPLKLHHLDHVARLVGGPVELSALQPGIHKGAQAHMGEHAGPSGGDVPEELGNGALGQVVAGQLVFRAQLAQPGGQPPVAADDLGAQALHPQMVQPPGGAVPLSGGVYHRQVFGALAGQRRLLQGPEDVFRVHQAAGEAAEGDGVPIMDALAHRLMGGQDLWHSPHFLSLSRSPRGGGPGAGPVPSGRAYGTAGGFVKCPI